MLCSLVFHMWVKRVRKPLYAIETRLTIFLFVFLLGKIRLSHGGNFLCVSNKIRAVDCVSCQCATVIINGGKGKFDVVIVAIKGNVFVAANFLHR